MQLFITLNMYKKVICTFLSLVLLKKCDDLAIVKALKKELLRLKLDLKNIVAIGTDNASVMVGINNGMYKQSVLNIIGSMSTYKNCSLEFDAVMHENLLFLNWFGPIPTIPARWSICVV